MGPELDNKQNLDMILEALAMENGTGSKEIDGSNVNRESNEGYTSLVEQAEPGSNDNEVDITGCTNSAANVLVESDREELTESSSSFESITAGAENCTATSDAECTSEYNGDTSELAFSEFGDFRMRRKKPTPLWREFIQPHRRLCKLIELKLHMLQSQARKYEKQMQVLNRQKQLQLASVQVEDLGSKSLPFSWNRSRDNVVKRKKRRRTEDTLDITAYTARHPLFSFFDNRKSIADGPFLDYELGDIAICSDKINADDKGIQHELQQQLGEGDTPLEKILRKIGVLQSRVSHLKTRLDKVTSENAGMFSSTDDLVSLLPFENALTSSAPSSASILDDRVKMAGGSCDVVSQLISEYNMVMPNGAASSGGEATNIPDVIDGSSLLLDTNTNPENDILIYNQRLKEERSNVEEFKIQPEEKPQVLTGLPDPDFLLHDQRAPKIRSISKLTAAPKSKKRKASRR